MSPPTVAQRSECMYRCARGHRFDPRLNSKNFSRGWRRVCVTSRPSIIKSTLVTVTSRTVFDTPTMCERAAVPEVYRFWV